MICGAKLRNGLRPARKRNLNGISQRSPAAKLAAAYIFICFYDFNLLIVDC